MNKLFTDMQYIHLINILGEHLQREYGLTTAQIQGIKHKLNLVIEEITNR